MNQLTVFSLGTLFDPLFAAKMTAKRIIGTALVHSNALTVLHVAW